MCEMLETNAPGGEFFRWRELAWVFTVEVLPCLFVWRGTILVVSHAGPNDRK